MDETTSGEYTEYQRQVWVLSVPIISSLYRLCLRTGLGAEALKYGLDMHLSLVPQDAEPAAFAGEGKAAQDVVFAVLITQLSKLTEAGVSPADIRFLLDLEETVFARD